MKNKFMLGLFLSLGVGYCFTVYSHSSSDGFPDLLGRIEQVERKLSICFFERLSLGVLMRNSIKKRRMKLKSDEYENEYRSYCRKLCSMRSTYAILDRIRASRCNL